jgi:oxepin-CoA hydrolase/3-oxo-5,6-dehydrosuberyl-CoA semialdehyde dehydrogenase
MYLSVKELVSKVDKLNSNTEPRWGTMTAQKMVEHLINTFLISSGQMKTECFSDEAKLPVLKKILMSDRPMPKGFDSPANKKVPQDYQFENIDTAIRVLAVEVDNYYNYFNENPDAVLMNPTFGELNKDEWEQFHKKHLTHHLTQFGLIE